MLMMLFGLHTYIVAYVLITYYSFTSNSYKGNDKKKKNMTTNATYQNVTEQRTYVPMFLCIMIILLQTTCEPILKPMSSSSYHNNSPNKSRT